MTELKNPFNTYMEGMDVIPFALCCSQLKSYTDEELDAVMHTIETQSNMARAETTLSNATREEKEITIALLQTATGNFIKTLKAVALEERPKVANSIVPRELIEFCAKITHMCGVVNWFIHVIYENNQDNWYEYGKQQASECDILEPKMLTDFLDMMHAASNATINLKMLPEAARKEVTPKVLQKNLNSLHNMLCEREPTMVELFHKTRAKLSGEAQQGEQTTDEIDQRLLTNISSPNTIH